MNEKRHSTCWNRKGGSALFCFELNSKKVHSIFSVKFIQMRMFLLEGIECSMLIFYVIKHIYRQIYE